MADNSSYTPGTGEKFTTDEVTYSGDTAKLGIGRIVHVTGSEGSKVVTELVRLEDAAHTSGDPGIPMLGVRADTAASLAGADGDYTLPIFDSSGRQHVNVGTSALPSGASTAAKQPALGTAGTASADVLTVQGITSMTALKVDGTGGSFPVTDSGGSLTVDGSVTATSATASNLKAQVVGAGSAGTADAGVLTVQGIASMTKLLVTPDSVALPSNQSVNISQINAVTPLMGAGNTGTGSLRVTVATDQAVIPISDNSASLTVDQPTGTNLHTVVDSGTITTVTTLTGTTTLTPGTGATNLGKAEDAAHSSGDAGVFSLAVSNENLTAFGAASGDYAPKAVNRYGQQYVTAPPPSHASSNGTPITATTTSVIAAPSAGNHLRVVRIFFSNGGATSTWIAVRDGASGTQHYRAFLPQNGLLTLDLNTSGPLDLTTATRLDIVLSAAGSVEYEVDYFTVAD